VVDLWGLRSECPAQFTRGIAAADVTPPSIALHDPDRIDARGCCVSIIAGSLLALCCPLVMPGLARIRTEGPPLVTIFGSEQALTLAA
jgi:hypothetical protein